MKGTTMQFGGGELGTISSAAVHAGTAGKLGYRLSIGHDQNQQWQGQDTLAFRSNKFNAQTEYALSQESKLLVSGGLTDVNRFDGLTSSFTKGDTRFSQSYAHVAYERPNFFVRSYWYQVNTTVNFVTNPILAGFIRLVTPGGSSISDGVGNTYNIEAQHTVELGTANRIIYGVNYRLNNASRTIGFHGGGSYRAAAK